MAGVSFIAFLPFDPCAYLTANNVVKEVEVVLHLLSICFVSVEVFHFIARSSLEAYLLV